MYDLSIPAEAPGAKWDLLLLDLEMRAEQVRQMKRYEPWKLAAALASASAVAGSAVAAAILWTAHLWGVS